MACTDVLKRGVRCTPVNVPSRLVASCLCHSMLTFAHIPMTHHTDAGHALQHLLTTQEHGMVAGIRGVEWDAVELPSQFMENWCYDQATVDGMAVHYETGSPIPADLWRKVKDSKNFMTGTGMLRQVHFSMLDLLLHSSHHAEDPHATAVQLARQGYQVAAALPEDRFLCGFSHIFAGGYSAGYFSYKWAEVLSADCFEAFEEVGLENEDAVKATGRLFRDTVLAQGGGRHPADVFRDFRGRDPKPDALLRHSGLTPGGL